ncbi:DUF4843 domain-containing protein [Chitinophaga nivalis]|uniref:DUF4843 domain-containing protein n=1 Tax=Chitinophaga nivalis TaxID=2991709 RepID=A0ABT3IP10_9BACT|nr:DUF4843 domain-containing protein [Chitinophaga nivalis]MCW3464612.1 DUF4843 domain-containing protein [Chitinophaga nivalis]MCW3485697.1 DUF4843 domain-containing protein [Chitinophaga nivalis]
MKNWKLYHLLFLAAAFAGCSKEPLETYKDEPRIYFNGEESTFTFAIRPSTQLTDTFKVRINYSGLTLRQALPVKFSVADTSTAKAGKDYELPANFAVPVGYFSDTLRILVKRTPEIATKAAVLVLRLEDNGSYTPGFGRNGKVIRLVINDMLTKPSSWESYLASYLGVYSKAKYRFIIDTLGMSDFPYDMVRNGQLLYYKIKLAEALAAYEKIHGPLIDAETGNQVFFPA